MAVELTSFSGAVQEIQNKFGAAFPECVSEIIDEDYAGLGRRYVAGLERLAPGTIRITDKIPGNFMFAGLIHLALPNAIIIHTARDPLDTCLSCFFHIVYRRTEPHL